MLYAKGEGYEHDLAFWYCIRSIFIFTRGCFYDDWKRNRTPRFCSGWISPCGVAPIRKPDMIISPLFASYLTKPLLSSRYIFSIWLKRNGRKLMLPGIASLDATFPHTGAVCPHLKSGDLDELRKQREVSKMASFRMDTWDVRKNSGQPAGINPREAPPSTTFEVVRD